MPTEAADRVARPAGQAAALGLLALAAAGCWAQLIGSAMAPDAMADMAAPSLAAPSLAAHEGLWALMTTAMMLPAGASLLVRRGADGAAILAIAAGYLAPWLAAAAVGAALAAALNGRAAGGAAVALAVVGLFQLSPWKQQALSACRRLGSAALPRGRAEALRRGAGYGLRCVASCAPLMLALAAAGLMSAAGMAGLTVWILLEKTLPAGLPLARLGGLALLAWAGLRLGGFA
jgi:predicted metal-binding membrane protein